MAKVKITGHASGSGVITVTAPNTSTDRTITLPDSTGTILDTTSTLDATKLSGTVAGFTSTGIDDNATSTAVTIDASENVGIGTTSPDSETLLHVRKGDAGGVDSATNSVLTLENNTTAILQFLTPNTANGQIRFGDPQDTGSGWIQYSHSASSLQFGTNGPEKMRIDSAGGVITNPTAGGDAIFNDASMDADFRVESDGNANMLRVDAGSNRVVVAYSGVAASNPGAQFQVGGSLTFQNYGLNSNVVTDTGISINQGSSGMAMQVLASNHSAAGTSTKAGQYFLKFYYSGNNAPAVTHVAGDNCVTFGTSGTNLTVQMPAGANAISFITNG